MNDVNLTVSDEVRLNGFADTFKILESVTDGFIALDRDWNFVYLNAEAAHTLGRAREDLKGKNLWTEFPELEETQFGQLYLRAVRENRVLTLEDYYAPFDSWFNVRAYPNESGLTLLFINVTEQKRAEEKLRESEEQYRVLFNSIDEGFCTCEVIFDEHKKPVDYRMLEVNPSFERLTGINAKEALSGKTIREVVPTLEEHWFEIYGRVAWTGESVRFVQGSDALGSWFDVYAFRIGEPEERKVAILFNNITERKRAEEILRDVNTRLQSTLAAGEIATWTWNIPNDRVYADKNLARLFSVSDEEANGGPIESYIRAMHEDDRERVEAKIAEAVEKGDYYETEYRVVQPDNSIRWVVARGNVERDESGTAINLPGVLVDITERKQAEEQLRRNHETFFNLVQNAPFGIYVVDGDFRLSQISLGSQKVFSNIEPLIGRDFAEILRTVWEEPFATEAIEHFRHTLATGEPYWARNTTEQRSNVENVESYDWKIERVILPNGQFGVVCYFYDLTEQRLVEQALRESDARLRLAIDISRTSTFDIDLLTDSVQTDVIGREIYGFEANETLTFSNIQSRFHPEDLPEVMRRVSAAFAPTGSDEFEVEQRIIRTDGETRWIRVRGRAFFENEGETRRAVRCLGTYIDITDSKKAEEALRESEARLRMATEAANIYNWEIDLAGKKLLWGANAAAVLGLPAELLPEQLSEAFALVHPEDLAATEEIVQKAIAAGGENFEMEFRLVNPTTNEAVWVSSQAAAVREGAENLIRFVGISQNITERKRREANLAFLADLAGDFSRLSTADEIMQAMGAKIGAYLNVSNCLFAEINEAQDKAIIEYAWQTTDTQELVGVHRLSEFVNEEFQQTARRGETIVIRNTQTDSRTDAAGYAAFNIHSFVTVPFHRNSEWKYLFTVNDTIARDWREDEIGLIQEATNRAFPRLERARAEEALRESEARFRNMADHAPVMIWVTEPDGFCSYLSKSWYEFTGQTPETGLGLGWVDATHPDDQKRAHDTFVQANERREPFYVEYRLRRKDGEYRWAIDSAQPRFAENGDFLGYIGSVIDITERKQIEDDLRETQKFTQAVIESVPTLIYIYDLDERRNIYLSPQITAMFGFSADEVQEAGTSLIAELFHPDDLESVAAHHHRIQSSSQNGVFSLQYRMKHRNGEWRWINSRDVVFKRGEDGKPTQILGTAEDITEYKQAEEALRESEHQVRVVTDALPVLISYIDAEQRYRFVNWRYTDWFKLPQEEIVGKHIREVIGEDAYRAVEPTMKRVLAGEEVEFEQLLHYKIGDKFVHVNYVPHFDTETGEVKGYYALVQDISERKKAEQALRESRAQLVLALQVGRAGTFEWDIKNNVNIWSPEIEELYGVPAGTFEGKFEDWAKRVVPEDVTKVRAGIETSLQMHLDEYIYEFRAVLPDGSHRWLEGRARFEYDEKNEPLRMFGINVDITDRKRAEEAVRESSEFNQDVLDSLLAHIAVLDKNGNITTVNQAWRRFALENGADWTMRGVGIGTNYLDVCRSAGSDDSDDARTIYQGIIAVLEGRSDFFSLEYPCHSPTQKRWFLLAVSPLSRTPEGGVVISHLNITARKLAEEALRESEARFRNVSDSAPVLIWLNGIEGCEYVNRQYLDFVGVDEISDVRGFDWAQFIHPDDYEHYINGYLRAFEKGENFVSQFRFRRYDGEYRWMTTTGLPRFSASDELLGYVGSTLDINDIKQAEEALREADRRKDEFLATLAHELRNPLAPIQTALEIMHSGSSKEKGQEAREIIERQVQQLRHLVDDLLDISRITQGKIILKKTRMDLRDALNAALEASRPSIDDNRHELSVSLPDEPVFIEGDLTRLAQVFLNLLNNAAKFTIQGGKISISAAVENENAVVRVKDNGLGIPPEMLERVFEMFSQVERNGMRPQTGLGIGLNLVKRLVEKHGGAVVARSAGINAGSEFIIHLPLAAEQTPLLNKEAENGTSSSAPVGKRRILVVDDNVDAADMLQFALQLDKHQVATAYDALSALNLANDFQPEVCLLDIGLPDINGYELARRLREKMPDVLLIALSGWGQDEDRRRSAEAGFNHHLVKPIKLEDINKLLK